MAKIGDYKISDIYQGGISSFSSSYPENNVTAGSLGLTTDPRTANVMKEVSSKLSSGVKHIEVEMISPEMVDSIPKQQLEGVKQLSKLTGVDISVHGPVIDTTGVTQNGFSELNRELAEKRVIQTLERSHEINPDGNVPVNFHSAEGIPGTEWKVIPDEKVGVKGQARRLIVIDRESGKPAPLEEETMYYPAYPRLKKDIQEKIDSGQLTEAEISKKIRRGEIKEESILENIPLEEGKIKTPESRMRILNHSNWDNKLSQVIFNKERADEILQKNAPILNTIIDENGVPKFDEETIKKSPTTLQALNHFQNARYYLEDTRQQIEAFFHQAYKYGNDKQKEELKKVAERFREDLNGSQNPIIQSKALQNLIINLKDNPVNLAPQMYVPIEDFAIEQSSKTYGNAAFKAYKKFGDKSPLLNIENPPAGFALSTGEELRKLVEESREQFVKNAVAEGMKEKEAKEHAEKLIGATWDVGHINMLRKQGFEEKDILRETEKIAPLVKHVHLSDNFGMEHTELPMGMGNVPMQEIMKRLGKKGFEAPKIIEAAQWWQHFQSPPVQQTFESLGSPIYSDGVGPYWNQSAGLQQGYIEGYGMMLPQTNYSTWGAGFSQLPKELGGQMPGAQGSRMSGRGME